MVRNRYFTVPAIMAGAVGFGAGGARAADPTTAELMQQIEQLQAKVQQLETKQEALAAADVNATVESVLRDADRRSQLLQMEGFTAGWQKGKGFVLQSSDGNWLLHPNFQFQFRSVTNYRDEAKHAGTDSDWENGFELRRVKFGFDGNAFTPDLQYFFLWQTDRNGGGVTADQMWVKYYFGTDWAVRLGQIVNPVFHEQTVSSRRQLAVDRSLVNEIITGSNEAQSQAVTLVWDSKDQPIVAELGFGDGFLSSNTNFVDPNEGGTADWDAFGRANWYVRGDHKSYDDFTAMGNTNDLLVIGGGLDVTQAGDITTYRHVVDAQAEFGPVGIYAAFLGNYIDDSGADNTSYNWGALAQAGYMVNEKLEIFGRYDYSKIDSDLAAGGDDSWSEITVGGSYYLIGGHNCKATVDLSYLPDGSPAAYTGEGILASDSAEWLLRAQFQLLI